jgi:murein DD-endopeptidase MepM/ murein hydrolase activator NlpD
MTAITDQRSDRGRAAAKRPAPTGRGTSWHPDPTWGAYSTAGLVRVARGLTRQGWRPGHVDARVFAPFPVGGPSAWTDTWGAPRYAGGYHPHHGQDLMCAQGTPLLAVKDGTIQLNSDPLGGVTLFLVRPNGSFWYYAHLSRYANSITDGTHVRAGQRIGRCGSTGDATVSHLHFALFSASGVARDPMRDLVRWLHAAERSAGLRPSTGNGVRLPKAFTHQVGDEPAQPVPGATVPSSPPFVAPAVVPHSQLVVTTSNGGGVGFLVGAALLLLPLPLASKRVRAKARGLRCA